MEDGRVPLLADMASCPPIGPFGQFDTTPCRARDDAMHVHQHASADTPAGAPAEAAAGPGQNLGELHPVGGGDPIPLLKRRLLVGRRESSDIVLRFPNVSGTHCELWVESGVWNVRDLKSSNGTKVNGERVIEQRLAPGDRLSVGRHHFDVHYEPSKVGGATTLLEDEAQLDIFGRSLLDSAGLERKRPQRPSAPSSGRPRR